MIFLEKLLMVDAYSVFYVLLPGNGKKPRLKIGLERLKKIIVNKRWLENWQCEIVVDSGWKNNNIQRENVFPGLDIVYTYKNKSRIPYSADDYIIDAILANWNIQKYDQIIIVTNDKNLQSNISGSITLKNVDVKFVNVEDFLKGKF